MRFLFLFTILTVLQLPLQAQWELGARLGDPLGITAKKYTGESALEFNFGRSELWYDDGWYRERGRGYYRDLNDDWDDFEYTDFDGGTPLSFQVHFLKHYPIKEIPNLYWYWGFGGQLRVHAYSESYRYKLPNSNNWIYERNVRTVDLDLGADGLAGLEYRFKEVPFTLGIDLILFLEVADDFFLPWWQGAMNIRYRF